MLRALFECGEDPARDVATIARWRCCKPRETILHQGSPSNACHIVTSGSVDLKLLSQDGKYFQMATVEVGEPFGVYPGETEMTVDAISRAKPDFLAIEASALARLALKHAELGAALAKLFAGQLHRLLGRFAARLTLSATGRVYEQLLDALDEHNAIAPVPVVAALALQAQTTRETASRAISDLERRGILRRERERWVIVSPRLLEDLLI